MKDMQKTVNEMIKKYNLESSTEIKFIDFISEVGELGKELLKGNNYGKKEFVKTDNLQLEMGDVLFSFVCLANDLHIDLQEAFDKVVEKYHARFLTKGNIGSEK